MATIHAGNKNKSMMAKDKKGGKTRRWQQLVADGKSGKNVAAG